MKASVTKARNEHINLTLLFILDNILPTNSGKIKGQ